MKIPIDLAVLQDMHESWRRKAVIQANAVKAVNDELKAAAAAKQSVAAERVLEMLNASVGFYKAVGHEDAIAEILTSLGSPPRRPDEDVGATSLQEAPAVTTQTDGDRPQPAKRWKIGG